MADTIGPPPYENITSACRDPSPAKAAPRPTIVVSKHYELDHGTSDRTLRQFSRKIQSTDAVVLLPSDATLTTTLEILLNAVELTSAWTQRTYRRTSCGGR